MDFETLIKQRLKQSEILLGYIDEWLAAAPKESLRVRKRGRRVYYNAEETLGKDGLRHESYISSKPNTRVLRLAQKHLCKKLAPVLRKNVKALDEFASKYNFNWLDTAKRLSPEILCLSDPLFITRSGRASAWSTFRPQTNPFHPERCVYETKSGDFVRSKSEMIIANILNDAGILFRYEARLKLGGKMVYPDFTILSPRDGRLIYWEHFGMMDIPEYCAEFINKKRLYNSCGLLDGRDVIFSFESESVPLSQKDIQREVDRLRGM